MSDFQKEISAKTAGGVSTFAGTYLFSVSIGDLQTYSIIFASVATGIYYLIQSYLAWRHRKTKNADKP